jgi:hypothetical protein
MATLRFTNSESAEDVGLAGAVVQPGGPNLFQFEITGGCPGVAEVPAGLILPIVIWVNLSIPSNPSAQWGKCDKPKYYVVNTESLRNSTLRCGFEILEPDHVSVCEHMGHLIE